MANKEHSMKVTVRNCLKGHGHFQSIEDRYSTGIPDLNLCIATSEMWVELKQISKLPEKIDTTLKTSLNHLTNDQVNWLLKRSNHGGRCFILLKVQVPVQWFLIAGKDAYDIKGWTRGDLYDNCVARRGALKADWLIEALVK